MVLEEGESLRAINHQETARAANQIEKVTAMFEQKLAVAINAVS